jgi:hypothetical protein
LTGAIDQENQPVKSAVGSRSSINCAASTGKQSGSG